MTNGRKIFIETLTELAEKNPKVILIIGDVGFSFLEKFKERFPNQFLNAGIGEQNMMGLAVGMAKEGWIPFVYTMSNFIILRPYEQVRNDICYGNANVKLIGVKGSEAYAFLGMSHNLYGDEEERLLKDLPNLNTYLDCNPPLRHGKLVQDSGGVICEMCESQEKKEKILKDNLLKEYNRIGPAYLSI